MFVIKTFFKLFSGRSASGFIIWLCMGILLGCSAEGNINGGDANYNGDWIQADPALEWVAPEEVGWSSAELQEAHDFAIQSNCLAVLALYDGKIFFSRGNIHRNYEVDSIRKPFLSALYGIHEARGNINLNAALEDYHIDDIPPGLTLSEKQARVEHLLMSRSGVYHEAADEDQTMIDTRPARGSHAPDTFFYYNNWDFNALGTIFEQEVGEEIFNAFKKEIADRVEMVDFSIDNCFYQYEWNKSLHPAYQFKMSARDMAKFGVLYQKNGRWNGLQIIQSDWIDDSTMAYSTMPNTAGLGYGYMWKIIEEDSDIGQVIGHAGYYYTGSGGHALVIIPDLKLVIVVRYNSDQNWDEPGAAGFELSMLIIDAKI
jgi:CubicO group peptidase (beta-lactamase class C family)